MKKSGMATSLVALSCCAGLALSSAEAAVGKESEAAAKAAATVEKMTLEEKVVLTHGIMPLPFGFDVEIPKEAIPGAGYVAGIPRLGIPALTETDASLGVSYIGGLRGDGATALPSGVAMASTWNPALLQKGGATIGAEARAKGFNVLLAGGANLMREPRNGRTFEYLSEDPLLTGVLVGASIEGIQSNNIISTIKHFALNGQETGRKFADSLISEAAARESDLLAFQIGIEIGNPGSVMCAYNPVNGAQSCASDWLLNKVLKDDWGYEGFVMSDWGAVPGLEAALKGLDQQSGAQLDPAVFFGDTLKDAAKSDAAYKVRLDDMNKRILTAIYANGLEANPAKPGGTIDFKAHADVAEEVAKQGIVLLKNEKSLLPLAKSVKSIAVIGGYANAGVPAGSGSSLVHAEGGPSVVVPTDPGNPFSALLSETYHASSPLKAIKNVVPEAKVYYRNGRYVADAVMAAEKADVAIVFATQWMTEGLDVPDLSLPNGQDALIAAVAKANPNTIVVLETGGPVLMPWLGETAAVMEAWYAGIRGGEAIASVLFGDTNPAGRLPITFPASLNDLPRPELDGAKELEPDFLGAPKPGETLSVNYDIEGSDLGYRYNAREGHKALFPFGYGLSYTSFTSSSLRTDGATASFAVTNTGKRAGATVAQLYLLARDGKVKQRLVGFSRVELAPGQTQQVSVDIDPRLLADWTDAGWTIAAGDYSFALGENAETLGKPVTVKMAARTWRD
ncbi:beta-glucosidase family protein [Pseudokordiimonas caeni]|uniref:beta-glucosidase family protein n=1 Tax=Pseudokordiimonas caeni TaxID=2997908 RepID=UPI003594608F